MDKNIEIIFPFAENRNAKILVLLQIFVTMQEMNLDEGLIEWRKFQEGKDLIIPINEANLADIEGYLRSFNYTYRVAHKTLLG